MLKKSQNDHGDHYLEEVIKIAKLAGEAILEVYHQSKIKVDHKVDHSPITQADLAANKIIEAGLKKIAPEIPIISEESASIPYETRKNWDLYWLVDPLDGTKEFISHIDEFTVNIALIDKHQSVLGVVYDPVRNELYYARHNQGAFLRTKDEEQRIKVRPCKTDDLAFAVSRNRKVGISSTWPFKNQPEIVLMGSSLKFCWVARGKVDFYPQFGKTSEWDTGAAQCVLEEAGGKVLDFNGDALKYNSKPSLINPTFLALGDADQLLKGMSLNQFQESLQLGS